MPDYSSLWTGEPTAKQATELLIRAFEKRHAVILPKELKQMYLQQNGGQLQDDDDCNCLLPLLDDRSHEECITSLQQFADHDSIDADDLDWIEEELGDPSRIFSFTGGDGHTTHALDYNAGKNPAVVWLDLECQNIQRVAASFAAWVKQQTKTDANCDVEWDERLRHKLIQSVDFDLRDERIEQALCRDGGNGLLLFTRASSAGRIELQRVQLPRGIDANWLDVQAHRPRPDRTFTLHLQPRETDDIHWRTSRQTPRGKWKNRRSVGVLIYCELESPNRKQLEAVADLLRAEGLVQESEPVDPELAPQLESLARMGELMKERQRASRTGKRPQPRSEPPPRGPAAEEMEHDAVIAEMSGLTLYIAKQVSNWKNKDDVERFIAGFTDHQQRYIELLRRAKSQAMLAAMALRPAEQVYKDAMKKLNRRSQSAFERFDRYDKATIQESLRPPNVGPNIKPMLEALERAAAEVARLLTLVNDCGAIAPHNAALESAMHEFARCDQRLKDACQTLDAAGTGWAYTQRLGSDADQLLRQQWDLLRLRNRKLFKANQLFFEPLTNHLSLWP